MSLSNVPPVLTTNMLLAIKEHHTDLYVQVEGQIATCFRGPRRNRFVGKFTVNNVDRLIEFCQGHKISGVVKNIVE